MSYRLTMLYNNTQCSYDTIHAFWQRLGIKGYLQLRYIGGKSLLLENIASVVDEKCEKTASVLDIFAGSGAVSAFLKQRGHQLFCNDILYFSYTLQRAAIGINKKPHFDKLKAQGITPLEYLNTLTLKDTGFSPEECFIYQNYSPAGSSRMYFQEKNALKIDLIRLTIEKWNSEKMLNEDEYFYLLASLINAVPYVANITGVYAAYLKFWDTRSYNSLKLQDIALTDNKAENRCFNRDYTGLLETETALLYADPPYNQREYAPNYHLLETIARYDYPAIKGVTGMRDYSGLKSDFCSKKTVASAFETMLRDCKSEHVLISYNNEGLISTAELSDICSTYAAGNSFELRECSYRRYKNKIPNNSAGLKEQLYYLRRY